MSAKQVKRIVKSLFSVWLLTLFVTYQVSISMFTHVHYINGVMITHSHPYQGTHSHTSSSLLVIDRLSSFHILLADASVTPVPQRTVLYTLVQLRSVGHVVAMQQQAGGLRAPPAGTFC